MNADPAPTAPRPFALIVTADDFGIGLDTSRGIIRAHRDGPVTATSLMAIMGDFARASVPLLADAPNLDVGLHLVLTACGHKPLVARRSSGLVARDGNFRGNAALWLQAWRRKLDRDAVADEIAAQADLFRKLLGRDPAYVDGHHHAHQLPLIRDALLDVIRQRHLPPLTRTTVEPPGLIRHVPGARPKRRAAHLLGRRAAPAFADAGIWSNDFFFGMLAPPDLRRVFPWENYLVNLPQAGVVEWVVHPGLPDETLSGRDAYQTGRPAELHALTSAVGINTWESLRPFLSRKSAYSAFRRVSTRVG